MRKPEYGVDAPGFVRGFFLAAAVSFSVAAAAWTVFPVGWVFWILLAVSGLVGVVTLFLGCVMTTYSLYGKFRQRDLMISKVPWTGAETVLDIGTGRGLLAIGAAKRLTSGKAIGIDVWSAKDLTDNTPERARRNAELEGVGDRVEIRDGDARKLDFADRSVDVVLSLLCIHNIEPVEEQDRASSEIARVLKPGGVALIGDYVPVDRYAKAMAAAGLEIRATTTHFRTACGPLFLVEAFRLH